MHPLYRRPYHCCKDRALVVRSVERLDVPVRPWPVEVMRPHVRHLPTEAEVERQRAVSSLDAEGPVRNVVERLYFPLALRCG